MVAESDQSQALLSQLSRCEMYKIVCRQSIHPLNKRTLAYFIAYTTSYHSVPGRFLPNRQASLASQLPPNQVVFSGIQPTGVPHLGNYLGALREWVKLQDNAPGSAKLIFSIVDLHAITVPQKPGLLREWKRQTLAALLAIGLDPNRSTIFYQSAVCVLLAPLASFTTLTNTRFRPTRSSCGY